MPQPPPKFPAPLNWKRIYPGYYETRSTARVGDKIRDVRIVVRRIPEWKGAEWANEIWMLRDDPNYPECELVRADDGPEATRAEANKSVCVCLAAGWDWYEGLGWCVG